MTLKPRRFWLPAIAVCFSGLLIWLEKALHAQNFLNILNEVFNLPAFTIFIQFESGLYPDACQHCNFRFFGWLGSATYLLIVGLCWYLVGVELDFHLLRKIAAKGWIFRFCWIAIGAVLQGVVIWGACLFLIEVVRHKPPEPFDPIASAFFLLIELAWLQLAALRLWREQTMQRKTD